MGLKRESEAAGAASVEKWHGTRRVSHMHQVSVQLTCGWLGRQGERPRESQAHRKRGAAAELKQLEAKIKKKQLEARDKKMKRAGS